ncbi:hypothetical protein ACHAWO_008399 [Cyclotella atomus]|uniref:Calmodulin-lysine N-methyltransferase n=1 Tax=Cyclotella atomus TaxID=382360 RepID=A0ABD3PX97_9STRA
MAYITIQIPPDATPGVDTLTFQYQGQELEISIPYDAQVGDVLQIQVGANDDGDVAACDGVDGGSDNIDGIAKGEIGKKSSPLDEMDGVHDKDETTVTGSKDDTSVALGSGTNPSFTLQLVESRPGMTQNEGDGTNAMVWPSGIVLAQALTCDAAMEYMNHMFNRKSAAESSDTSFLHCMELGSGLGVCGLALARALKLQNIEARILLTDLGETAIELLKENIQRNQQAFTSDDRTVNVEATSLIWGETLPNTEKFDVILGSDLLYNTSESYEPLLQTITQHLHQDGTMVLAVRWRKPDLEKQFFEKASVLGLKFVLWKDVMETPQLRTRCPCQLSWKEYGDSECEAFKTFFCETKVSISNNAKSLAEINESDMEYMSDTEYTKFEECQIQLYVGKFVNIDKTAAKKRSIGDISS